jgi:hypothetical protein
METSNKLIGEPLSDLTLFAVDTLASHLAPLASDEEPTTLDTYGHGSETALATYDPDTQSWKTSGDISLWGEQPLLKSLPKSGMTRNGVLFQQPDWVRPIDANESSLLHTPTATMNQMSPSMVARSGWWPTPRSSSAMADEMATSLDRVNRIGYKARLEEAVAMNGNPSGKLNPTWVEWLMGFPLGWTDLEG